MGNTEKLMNQIMELKFTSESLQAQARKCEKEEKSEMLKAKKAMEKGKMEGAQIYAENAIRKRTEQMNYLRLASRLDAIVDRLHTHTLTKPQVHLLHLQITGNLQKMRETINSIEKQFLAKQ